MAKAGNDPNSTAIIQEIDVNLLVKAYQSKTVSIQNFFLFQAPRQNETQEECR